MAGGGRARLATGVLLAAAGALGGCYLGGSPAGGGVVDAAADRPVAVPDGGFALTGLPCDVAQALTPCLGCHVPGGSGPMPLLGYGDLTKPALTNPAVTVAQLSVTRMTDPQRPMPPAPAAPAAGPAVTALQAWIAAGYPHGSCGGARDAGVAVDAPPIPDGGLVAAGLPCDVAQALVPCTTCHRPGGSGPMSLLSYADLTAPARSDPARTVAQLCVVRMQSTTTPMPPAPATPASAAEIAAIQGWIAAAYPHGTCGGGGDGGTATDPYGTPPTCTSGAYTSFAGDVGTAMYPGRACIACHLQSGEAPIFSLAGTLYPTAHEYDDCNGSGAAGTTVVVVDAVGQQVTMTPDHIGNFASFTPITRPYAAKIVSAGLERAMVQHQSSGDCNSCHTLTGANGAPGRIVIP